MFNMNINMVLYLERDRDSIGVLEINGKGERGDMGKMCDSDVGRSL